MPKLKLTKRAVEAAKPQSKDLILWDTDLKGFGCKVTPIGRKVYFLYYRTASGQQRRPTIGVHGRIEADKARSLARQWLADVAKGNDPSAERREARQAETVSLLPREGVSIDGATKVLAMSFLNITKLKLKPLLKMNGCTGTRFFV